MADTLGVNRSTAREIVARYITVERGVFVCRERPRGGGNNVLVDDEMRQCLEEIVNKLELCSYTKPDEWGVEAKTSCQTSDS